MSFSSFVHNFLYPKSAAEQAAEAAAKREAKTPFVYTPTIPDAPEPRNLSDWTEAYLKHQLVVIRDDPGLEKNVMVFLYFRIGDKRYSAMGATRVGLAMRVPTQAQIDVVINHIARHLRDTRSSSIGVLPLHWPERSFDIHYSVVDDRYNNQERIFKLVGEQKDTLSSAMQIVPFGEIFASTTAGWRQSTAGVRINKTADELTVAVEYADYITEVRELRVQHRVIFEFFPVEVVWVRDSLYVIPSGVVQLTSSTLSENDAYYSNGYEMLRHDCSPIMSQMRSQKHLEKLRTLFRWIFSKEMELLSDFLTQNPVEGSVLFFSYRYSVLDSVWYILYQGVYFDTVIQTDSGWEFTDTIRVHPRPVEERLSDMVKNIVGLRDRVDGMQEVLGPKMTQVQLSRLTSAAIILAQFRETSTQWPEVEDRVRAILIDSSLAVGSAEIAMDPLNRSCDLLTSPPLSVKTADSPIAR